MDIQQLIQAGDLKAAVEQATREVKANPMQPACRITLFELLSLCAEWDRAEKQLQVLMQTDASRHFGIQVYRNILAAEKSRQLLFSHGTAPHFLREPPDYVDQLLAGIDKVRSGEMEDAGRLLAKAEEDRPALRGLRDGNPFSDFRDVHDGMGSVLEVVVHDKYTWVPWEQILCLEVTPPRHLRDLLWIPARIQSRDGAVGEVFLFSLYPGSGRSDNPPVQLGRMTDWQGPSDAICFPLGLRVFQMDQEEVSLLECRSLQFEEGPSEAQEKR